MSMDNILLGTLAVLLFFTYKNNKQVVENFLNVPLQSKVERVKVFPSGKKEVIPQSQMYMVPSNYQATVPPRQASIGYGAYTRYNPPSAAMRAESMGSLAGRTLITEGFSNGNGNGNGVLPSYSNGVVTEEKQPAPAVEEKVNGQEEVVEVQEGGLNLNELGKTEPQPIIIDRMYYANSKSRTLASADFIRGDLAIIPDEHQGWFRPSANPATDLRAGALMVMGGADNESAKELMALKAASQGKTSATGGGINYTVQKSSFMSSGGGDVSVKTTSFP